MLRQPSKLMKNKQKPLKRQPKTPIGQPEPRFVYRKDAFKKVKIT